MCPALYQWAKYTRCSIMQETALCDDGRIPICRFTQTTPALTIYERERDVPMPLTTLVSNAGREIVDDVDGCAPPAGSVAVWFIGQAGFILKFPSGTVCYLDPWLSDLAGATRAYPIPIDPELRRKV